MKVREKQNNEIQQTPKPAPNKPMLKCQVCGAETTLKCQSCFTAIYCKRDCQRTDWPKHKLVCKKFAEEEIPNRVERVEKSTMKMQEKAIKCANSVMRAKRSKQKYPIDSVEYFDNMAGNIGQLWKNIEEIRQVLKKNMEENEKLVAVLENAKDNKSTN